MAPALRLKGRDWGFIAVAGAVVGALVVLSMLGKEAAPLAPRPEHAQMTAVSTRADCLACHDPTAPGATAPMPADHPLTWKKETVSCTVCHQLPAEAQRASRPAHAPFDAGRTSR